MQYFPKRWNQWIVTWFGCGYFPKAPGTAGSVAALPLCWIFSAHTNLLVRIVFAIGMTCIAILASAQDQQIGDKRDPSYIVVDEVAGMLWSTLIVPNAWLPMLCAFGLFRICDILKPFPANWFDRRSKVACTPFERGVCIVMDDVVAGLWTTLICFGLISYYGPRFASH